MRLFTFVILTILSFTNCKVLKMTCKHIRAFVDGHNDRRFLLAQGKVPGQPAASEMRKMVWDEELQEKAAKWASKHEIHGRRRRHNPDKTVPSGRFKTSENLYWYSTTSARFRLNPEKALDSWFNEHKNFTFGPLNAGHFNTGKKDIGHYTQMVWSDSIYVGCAISKKVERQWRHYFVVCNYGPQGNILGRQPYRTGHASGKLMCHRRCKNPYGNKCE